MYTVGEMTHEHAKQAIFLGSFPGFWSGLAFSNPAVELQLGAL